MRGELKLIIQYYDMTEAELEKRSFKAGCVYYCTDSRNIYLDSPVELKRKRMSSDAIILASESERHDLVSPVPDKIYIVIATSSIYVYTSGAWKRIGVSHFSIENILAEPGSVILDDRVVETDTAKFIPDLSCADLATGISCACSNGSITITMTSDYPIPGKILVN